MRTLSGASEVGEAEGAEEVAMTTTTTTPGLQARRRTKKAVKTSDGAISFVDSLYEACPRNKGALL